MDKEAKNLMSDIFLSMVPFAYTMDSYNPDSLPNLSSDLDTNRLAWNIIMSGASTLGGTALLKAISHRINAKKWENKSKKIAQDKANALYPTSTYSTTKDEPSFWESLTKQASLPDDAANALEKLWTFVKDSGKSSLPIAAAISGALVGPSLIQDRLEDKDKDELDAQITEKQNRLDHLRAQIIQRQLNKSATGEFVIGTPLGVFLAALTTGAFTLSNKYFKDHDKARKIVEIAEDAAAHNLTNIPQRLSVKLALNSPNKLKVERKNTVPKEEPVKTLPSKDQLIDFSDKITKVEKDALFS